MKTTHEPPGYVCPFCRLAAGGETARSAQRDIVRRTAGAMAFISPRWWPNNHGHVLVVPDLVREVAMAVRHTYGCDGVSTRQHNEPAGNQDAWHYHVHVFPRYADDAARPYPEFVTAGQRWPYADRLRSYFEGAQRTFS